MGRYYNGDIDGKFMFAVQSSDAHERFGAIEEEKDYIPYVVYRDAYAEICAELDSIKHKGHIDKVEKMFEKEPQGYNNEIQKKLSHKEYRNFIKGRMNNVTDEDLSEYADYQIGIQLKEFFDDNPDLDECRFEAEL